MNKKILVVAAHPDDEVLGCGGTIVKLVKQGHEAFVLILSKGKASRLNADYAVEELEEDLEQLEKETIKANRLLGVKKLFTADFPDNRFDSVDLLDIIKRVEEVKEEVKPDIVFTHHVWDINIDHQLTHKAVITAMRPVIDECVKNIYAFEIPSSTEWNSFSQETNFVPNVFYDISDTIDLKIEAMALYESELKQYPHPRSLQHLRELARVNGTKVGIEYSENYMLVRSIRR